MAKIDVLAVMRRKYQGYYTDYRDRRTKMWWDLGVVFLSVGATMAESFFGVPWLFP